MAKFKKQSSNEKDVIVQKILELKRLPFSQKNKLKIQKLQQELNEK